ncbi:MAG: metallophosphoesterase [Oscillospiraceae bacterium]|nr:metallophosphoesterase [Oscillospiraceae bacterium]
MKILFLSDIHYDYDKDNINYPELNRVHSVLWDWLDKVKNDFALIIFGGDLVLRGSTRIEELRAFKEKADAIGHPYQVVPGNHDMGPRMKSETVYPGLEEYEYKELEETNFAKVFGEKGLRNITYVNGVKIIGFALRNNDPDGQLVWLEKELEEPVPKLVYSHYPVVPARSGGYCSTWDYRRIEHSKDTLANLLKNPEYQVAAYLCGHLHINSVVPVGDCLQIVTGTVGSGITVYREIEISEKELNITTKRLPHFPEFVGQVTNPDEEHSTDAEHKTVRDYHLGNEIERNLVIDLTRYRR